MKKYNEKPTDKTSQHSTAALKAQKCYIQPIPPQEHRFSYRVDIVRHNHPYHADFLTPLPIGGYYNNSPEPLKARAIAFRWASEVPDDPELSLYGDFTARIWFVDEQEKECRLIHDMVYESTVEICQNLEWEFNLLKGLGYEISDWELVTAPNGNAYHAIRSEFKIAELCPCHFEPVLNLKTARLGL